MLDKLIDVLLSFLDKAIFVWIIKQYEEGVMLRFGKFHRRLYPGLYWKIPFVDEVLVHSVITDTLGIPTQSLTTKDNKQIVVKSMVKYKIEDVKKFLLEVQGASEALSDITQSIIRKQITSRLFTECSDDSLDNEITKKLRNEVKKWGISIDAVTLTTISKGFSLRLFNDQIGKDGS